MKEKKVPLRTCVITKEHLPKKELLRIVRTPENTVCYDLTGKVNGHGAYVKKDIEVIKKAKKSHALDKHLETNIPDSLYDQIIELLEDKNEA